MDKFYILLWKNFLWCKRHPLRTLFMYIFPLMFASFVLLVLKLMNIKNLPDCDYQLLALPPSHPVIVVSSLVCSGEEECKKKDYKAPHEILRTFFANSTDEGRSRLCPGKNTSEFQEAVLWSLYWTCLPRRKGLVYRSIPAIDLVYRGQLLYYPDTEATREIVQFMIHYLDDIALYRLGFALKNSSGSQAQYQGMIELAMASACFQPLRNRTYGFENRREALAYSQKLELKTDAAWGIVEFRNVESDFQYNLLTHYDSRDKLATLYLQSLVEMAIIQYQTGQKPPVTLEQKLLPKRCSKDISAYDPAYAVLQITFSIGMVAVAQTITSEMCYEKAAGLLEFLFIAGVKRWKVKLSWLLFGLVFFVTVGLFLSVFFKFLCPRLIEHTAFGWFFALCLLYACALLSLCFLLASLVPNSQRASVVTFLILLIAYLTPLWAQLVPRVGYAGNRLWFVKVASFLHCTFAMEIGLAYIIAWEKLEIGVNWENIDRSPIIGDRFGGVMEVMSYLFLQFIFYGMLSAYFDRVAPSRFGVKLPWYFPVLISYWRGTREPTATLKENKTADVSDIEPLNHRKSVGVMLQNLTKKYGDKFAVKHLSVTLYQNEITALLGHNGAGKSSTMNMLTGMIVPSTGTAVINGKDIWSEMTNIRSSLGFCPQFDVIYPEMTVEQHIHFFGTLKEITDENKKMFSLKIFGQFGMELEMNTQAKDLSGGQKRKLSIAIALLGDPKTVILDEPTSAIDPFSRRAIWDVILKQKAQSTVLISTHYMQEADILGDRIAIMSRGKLRCFGTPMYLKSRYASKCYLRIAHRTKIDPKGLKEKLEQLIPVTLKSATFGETTFALQSDVTKSHDIVEAFSFLEDKGQMWEITSFGISESTMEQVFFNVATENHSEEQSAVASPEINETVQKKQYDNQNGLSLFFIQILAIWIKRFQMLRKSKLGLCFQVLMPLAFMAIMVLLNSTVAFTYRNTGKMLMHPWNSLISRPTLFHASEQQSNLSESLLYLGLSIMCLNGTHIPGRMCNNDMVYMPAVTQNQSTKPCDCRKCPSDAIAPSAMTQLRTGDILINLSQRNITDYLVKADQQAFIGGIEEIVISPPRGEDVMRLFEQGIPEVIDTIQQTDWYTELNEAVSKVSEIKDSLAVVGQILRDPASLLFMTPEKMLSITGAISTVMRELAVVPKTGHVLWTGIKIEDNLRPTKLEKDMLHMKAAFLNSYNNVLLRSMVTVPEKYGITMYTEEVSLILDLSVGEIVSGLLLGLFSSLALLMPSFTVLLIVVNENATGNKKLQFLMGLNKLAYWLANSIWDIGVYFICVVLVMLFMKLFPKLFSQDFLIYFEIAMLFGISKTLLSYVMTFFFKTARNAILVIGNLSPLLTFTAIILLNWYEESWFAIVDTYLCFFPSYFVLSSLVRIQFNEYLPNPQPLFSWNVLGQRFMICSAFSLLMLILLIVLECEIIPNLMNFLKFHGNKIENADEAEKKDEDVLEEEMNVLNSTENEDNVLLVKGLLKRFDNGGKTAVKGVTFSSKKGECFGLLGVNGAGKSTLFNMLTGFLKPTSGDATIMGHSIYKGHSKVAKHMSYCPQQDVLLDHLTPVEHLSYYSRIRGIPSSEIQDIVMTLIQEVGLSLHTEKMSKDLSGGNKRKLNLAIAMLDYPSVIFLDEMTTGMDPKARRATWDCLRKAVNMGCTALINSHSLEETETLCHRLVIMVNGRFKCIGGVQYLKDKYGKNYNLKFRTASDTENLKDKLCGIWPGMKITVEHTGYLEVEIPVQHIRLSEVFANIHRLRQEYEIADFSVSQTTLEHVFVDMAREQE